VVARGLVIAIVFHCPGQGTPNVCLRAKVCGFVSANGSNHGEDVGGAHGKLMKRALVR